MPLTKRTKSQIAGLIQIVGEAYDMDITKGEALEALVNYGFLNFLKELPDIKFIIKNDERLD